MAVRTHAGDGLGHRITGEKWLDLSPDDLVRSKDSRLLVVCVCLCYVFVGCLRVIEKWYKEKRFASILTYEKMVFSGLALFHGAPHLSFDEENLFILEQDAYPFNFQLHPLM